jgi:hypothetical protein
MFDAFLARQEEGERRGMRFLRSVYARIRALWMNRMAPSIAIEPMLLSFGPAIYRDVSPQGVRVYSLCGACGARLECSATLCGECAQGPQTSAF